MIEPPPGIKREAVSTRLRQMLVHPDKSGVLLGLAYTPDGRQIYAGHYSSGNVQSWDAATGEQRNRIETGPAKIIGFRDYFLLSPDGRSLYVNRGSIGGRYTKGKEKRVYHAEVISGNVRVWDVETGKPRHDFPLPPDRGVVVMDLSPDGSTLLTSGVVSGDYDGPTSLKKFGTLWDGRTWQRHGELPDQTDWRGVFSPDSASLLTSTVNDKGETTSLLILGAASGKVRRSIPVEQRNRRVTRYRAFSPDGKRVVCGVVDTKTRDHWLKCWDIATGRETSSFAGENRGFFNQPMFSPDGRMLAVTHWFTKGSVYLIDAVKGNVIKIVPLAQEEGWTRRPVFSPDGKWVAVLSQDNPTHQNTQRLRAELLPQPRILLIEAATGEVRETIVAPQGIAVSLCFSPDGKTLASGGDGRVLLWDMTKPPVAWATGRAK